MPEEIRKHMMGHKYHDPILRAHYTPDHEDLKKVYVTIMEHVTISERLPITMEEFRELKIQNKKLSGMVFEMERELKELKVEV